MIALGGGTVLGAVLQARERRVLRARPRLVSRLEPDTSAHRVVSVEQPVCLQRVLQARARIGKRACALDQPRAAQGPLTLQKKNDIFDMSRVTCHA